MSDPPFGRGVADTTAVVSDHRNLGFCKGNCAAFTEQAPRLPQICHPSSGWSWSGKVSLLYRIKQGGFSCHLVLLRLEHDASFQMYAPFRKVVKFLAVVVEGFAKGAHVHHHLVFKTHPLKDGRFPVLNEIMGLGPAHGVAGRVQFVRGGKVARLLDHARTASW